MAQQVLQWLGFAKKEAPATSPVVAPVAPSKPFKMKCDTDHAVGAGQMAVTGRFDSKGDALRLESAYLLAPALTAHAKYGITDERLLAVGLEGRFELLGRANTLDLIYAPASDVGTVKLSVKQGRAKVAGAFSFDGLRARGVVAPPGQHYELNAKLTGAESMKIVFNNASKATKVKWTRRLDAANRFDVELHYPGAGANKPKYGVLSLNHAISKRQALNLSTNYGAKKHEVEWTYKTAGGPWTVSTDLAFDKPRGNWHVKRRFEF